MASENAKAVAKDVIKKLEKGEKVVFSQIMENRGYRKNTIKNPINVTNTESYKKEIEPLLDRLMEERDRAIALLSKTISTAKYRDLVDGIDKITKNIQLLNGGATERLQHSISSILDELEK